MPWLKEQFTGGEKFVQHLTNDWKCGEEKGKLIPLFLWGGDLGGVGGEGEFKTRKGGVYNKERGSL